MKNVYLINTLVCLFSAIALANEPAVPAPTEPPLAPTAPEAVVSVPKTETIYPGTSKFNRQSKKNMAVGQLGINSSLAAAGVAFGWYLNPNSILVIETLFGSDTSGQDYNNYLSTTTRWGYKNDTKGTFVGAHVKTFVSNSFYYKLGAEAKSIKYRYSSYDQQITSDNFERRFDGSAFGAIVALGNQWQWRGFTLGCDWVGAHIPLTSNITNEYTNGTNNEKTKLKTETERYITEVAVNALNLYIGASF